MWLSTGNSTGVNPGVTTIVGNTCIGPFSTEGFNFDNDAGGPLLTFPEQDYRVFNNIIYLDNPAASRFIRATTTPSGFQAGGNVYSGSASWSWGGTNHLTLGAWQAGSGSQDLTSQTCSPIFVDLAGFNAHLSASDTCAADKGVNISAYTTRDYDGDTRPTSGSDAGADER